jgi:hypothetical protein
LIFILLREKSTREVKSLGLGIIFGSLFVIVQLFLWKITTGDFFYFTYYDYEGFNLNLGIIPRIFFSFNPHGLIPWSPIFLLSILGAIKAFAFNRIFFIVSLIIFSLNSVIFASWSQPFGGGSFGNRFFVDLYPLLFVSLIFSYNFSNRKLTSAIYLYSAVCSIITVYLTFQYWKGEIDYGGIPISEYLNIISNILRLPGYLFQHFFS